MIKIFCTGYRNCKYADRMNVNTKVDCKYKIKVTIDIYLVSSINGFLKNRCFISTLLRKLLNQYLLKRHGTKLFF